MKVVRNLIPETTLEAFANQHSLVLEVNERRDTAWGDRKLARYYARFKDAEVMERGMLASVSGDGNTEDEAIANYAERISLKRIAIGAYTKDRQEIDVPRLHWCAS